MAHKWTKEQRAALGATMKKRHAEKQKQKQLLAVGRKQAEERTFSLPKHAKKRRSPSQSAKTFSVSAKVIHLLAETIRLFPDDKLVALFDKK